MTGIDVHLVMMAVLTSIIVGVVTASLRIYMDRFFLIILLVFWLGAGIRDAIVINFCVMILAGGIAFFQHRIALNVLPRERLYTLLVLVALGAGMGRLLSFYVPTYVLEVLFGLYAMAVGIRLLVLSRPPMREGTPEMKKASGVCAPLSVLTGLIGTGAKPFSIPMLVLGAGASPQRAYVIATVAVLTASISALGTHLVLGGEYTLRYAEYAVYFAVSIALVSLAVDRVWTPKLQRIVSLVVGPVLVLVGVKFLMLAL